MRLYAGVSYKGRPYAGVGTSMRLGSGATVTSGGPTPVYRLPDTDLFMVEPQLHHTVDTAEIWHIGRQLVAVPLQRGPLRTAAIKYINQQAGRSFWKRGGSWRPTSR